MKINKINELKKLNKSSINYEILVAMVKNSPDIEWFCKECLSALEIDVREQLDKSDNKLTELRKASDQLELQIEIIKTDIENFDHIKKNEMRLKAVKEDKISACIQYWTNSNKFEIMPTTE